MSSTKNVKKFWNDVNRLSNNAGIQEEMFFNDKLSMSGKEACNIFASNFELVYLNNLITDTKKNFSNTIHATYDIRSNFAS